MYGSYNIFFQCFYTFVQYGYILPCFMEKKPCCSGYKWNDTKESCIRCSAGYYSLNCSERCRYPNYGDDCQQECLCEEKFCDPSVGCSSTSLSTLVQTSIRNDGTTDEYSDKKVMNFTPAISLSTEKTKITDETKNGKDLGPLKLSILFLLGIFLLFFAVFIGKEIHRKCRQTTNERKQQNTVIQRQTGNDSPLSVQINDLDVDQCVLPVKDATKCSSKNGAWKHKYKDIEMSSYSEIHKKLFLNKNSGDEEKHSTIHVDKEHCRFLKE